MAESSQRSSYFTPAEVAMLVLGYLKGHKLNKTMRSLLKEARDLLPFWQNCMTGENPNLRICGYDFEMILEEFAAGKLKRAENGEPVCLPEEAPASTISELELARCVAEKAKEVNKKKIKLEKRRLNYARENQRRLELKYKRMLDPSEAPPKIPKKRKIKLKDAGVQTLPLSKCNVSKGVQVQTDIVQQAASVSGISSKDGRNRKSKPCRSSVLESHAGSSRVKSTDREEDGVDLELLDQMFEQTHLPEKLAAIINKSLESDISGPSSGHQSSEEQPGKDRSRDIDVTNIAEKASSDPTFTNLIEMLGRASAMAHLDVDEEFFIPALFDAEAVREAEEPVEEQSVQASTGFENVLLKDSGELHSSANKEVEKTDKACIAHQPVRPEPSTSVWHMQPEMEVVGIPVRSESSTSVQHVQQEMEVVDQCGRQEPSTSTHHIQPEVAVADQPVRMAVADQPVRLEQSKSAKHIDPQTEQGDQPVIREALTSFRHTHPKSEVVEQPGWPEPSTSVQHMHTNVECTDQSFRQQCQVSKDWKSPGNIDNKPFQAELERKMFLENILFLHESSPSLSGENEGVRSCEASATTSEKSGRKHGLNESHVNTEDSVEIDVIGNDSISHNDLVTPTNFTGLPRDNERVYDSVTGTTGEQNERTDSGEQMEKCLPPAQEAAHRNYYPNIILPEENSLTVFSLMEREAAKILGQKFVPRSQRNDGSYAPERMTAMSVKSGHENDRPASPASDGASLGSRRRKAETPKKSQVGPVDLFRSLSRKQGKAKSVSIVEVTKGMRINSILCRKNLDNVNSGEWTLSSNLSENSGVGEQVSKIDRTSKALTHTTSGSNPNHEVSIYSSQQDTRNERQTDNDVIDDHTPDQSATSLLSPGSINGASCQAHLPADDVGAETTSNDSIPKVETSQNNTPIRSHSPKVENVAVGNHDTISEVRQSCPTNHSSMRVLDLIDQCLSTFSLSYQPAQSAGDVEVAGDISTSGGQPLSHQGLPQEDVGLVSKLQIGFKGAFAANKKDGRERLSCESCPDLTSAQLAELRQQVSLPSIVTCLGGSKREKFHSSSAAGKAFVATILQTARDQLKIGLRLRRCKSLPAVLDSSDPPQLDPLVTSSGSSQQGEAAKKTVIAFHSEASAFIADHCRKPPTRRIVPKEVSEDVPSPLLSSPFSPLPPAAPANFFMTSPLATSSSCAPQRVAPQPFSETLGSPPQARDLKADSNSPSKLRVSASFCSSSLPAILGDQRLAYRSAFRPVHTTSIRHRSRKTSDLTTVITTDSESSPFVPKHCQTTPSRRIALTLVGSHPDSQSKVASSSTAQPTQVSVAPTADSTSALNQPSLQSDIPKAGPSTTSVGSFDRRVSNTDDSNSFRPVRTLPKLETLGISLPPSPSKRQPRRVRLTQLSSVPSTSRQHTGDASCSLTSPSQLLDESKIVSSSSDHKDSQSEAQAFKLLKSFIASSYTRPQPRQEITSSNQGCPVSAAGRSPQKRLKSKRAVLRLRKTLFPKNSTSESSAVDNNLVVQEPEDNFHEGKEGRLPASEILATTLQHQQRPDAVGDFIEGSSSTLHHQQRPDAVGDFIEGSSSKQNTKKIDLPAVQLEASQRIDNGGDVCSHAKGNGSPPAAAPVVEVVRACVDIRSGTNSPSSGSNSWNSTSFAVVGTVEVPRQEEKIEPTAASAHSGDTFSKSGKVLGVASQSLQESNFSSKAPDQASKLRRPNRRMSLNRSVSLETEIDSSIVSSQSQLRPQPRDRKGKFLSKPKHVQELEMVNAKEMSVSGIEVIHTESISACEFQEIQMKDQVSLVGNVSKYVPQLIPENNINNLSISISVTKPSCSSTTENAPITLQCQKTVVKESYSTNSFKTSNKDSEAPRNTRSKHSNARTTERTKKKKKVIGVEHNQVSVSQTNLGDKKISTLPFLGTTATLKRSKIQSKKCERFSPIVPKVSQSALQTEEMRLQQVSFAAGYPPILKKPQPQQVLYQPNSLGPLLSLTASTFLSLVQQPQVATPQLQPAISQNVVSSASMHSHPPVTQATAFLSDPANCQFSNAHASTVIPSHSQVQSACSDAKPKKTFSVLAPKPKLSPSIKSHSETKKKRLKCKKSNLKSKKVKLKSQVKSVKSKSLVESFYGKIAGSKVAVRKNQDIRKDCQSLEIQKSKISKSWRDTLKISERLRPQPRDRKGKFLSKPKHVQELEMVNAKEMSVSGIEVIHSESISACEFQEIQMKNQVNLGGNVSEDVPQLITENQDNIQTKSKERSEKADASIESSSNFQMQEFSKDLSQDSTKSKGIKSGLDEEIRDVGRIKDCNDLQKKLKRLTPQPRDGKEKLLPKPKLVQQFEKEDLLLSNKLETKSSSEQPRDHNERLCSSTHTDGRYHASSKDMSDSGKDVMCNEGISACEFQETQMQDQVNFGGNVNVGVPELISENQEDIQTKGNERSGKAGTPIESSSNFQMQELSKDRSQDSTDSKGSKPGPDEELRDMGRIKDCSNTEMSRDADCLLSKPKIISSINTSSYPIDITLVCNAFPSNLQNQEEQSSQSERVGSKSLQEEVREVVVERGPKTYSPSKESKNLYEEGQWSGKVSEQVQSSQKQVSSDCQKVTERSGSQFDDQEEMSLLKALHLQQVKEKDLNFSDKLESKSSCERQGDMACSDTEMPTDAECQISNPNVSTASINSDPADETIVGDISSSNLEKQDFYIKAGEKSASKQDCFISSDFEVKIFSKELNHSSSKSKESESATKESEGRGKIRDSSSNVDFESQSDAEILNLSNSESVKENRIKTRPFEGGRNTQDRIDSSTCNTSSVGSDILDKTITFEALKEVPKRPKNVQDRRRNQVRSQPRSKNGRFAPKAKPMQQYEEESVTRKQSGSKRGSQLSPASTHRKDSEQQRKIKNKDSNVRPCKRPQSFLTQLFNKAQRKKYCFRQRSKSSEKSRNKSKLDSDSDDDEVKEESSYSDEDEIVQLSERGRVHKVQRDDRPRLSAKLFGSKYLEKLTPSIKEESDSDDLSSDDDNKKIYFNTNICKVDKETVSTSEEEEAAVQLSKKKRVQKGGREDPVKLSAKSKYQQCNSSRIRRGFSTLIREVCMNDSTIETIRINLHPDGCEMVKSCLNLSRESRSLLSSPGTPRLTIDLSATDRDTTPRNHINRRTGQSTSTHSKISNGKQRKARKNGKGQLFDHFMDQDVGNIVSTNEVGTFVGQSNQNRVKHDKEKLAGEATIPEDKKQMMRDKNEKRTLKEGLAVEGDQCKYVKSMPMLSLMGLFSQLPSSHNKEGVGEQTVKPKPTTKQRANREPKSKPLPLSSEEEGIAFDNENTQSVKAKRGKLGRVKKQPKKDVGYVERKRKRVKSSQKPNKKSREEIEPEANAEPPEQQRDLKRPAFCPSPTVDTVELENAVASLEECMAEEEDGMQQPEQQSFSGVRLDSHDSPAKHLPLKKRHAFDFQGVFNAGDNMSQFTQDEEVIPSSQNPSLNSLQPGLVSRRLDYDMSSSKTVELFTHAGPSKDDGDSGTKTKWRYERSIPPYNLNSMNSMDSLQHTVKSMDTLERQLAQIASEVQAADHQGLQSKSHGPSCIPETYGNSSAEPEKFGMVVSSGRGGDENSVQNKQIDLPCKFGSIHQKPAFNINKNISEIANGTTQSESVDTSNVKIQTSTKGQPRGQNGLDMGSSDGVHDVKLTSHAAYLTDFPQRQMRATHHDEEDLKSPVIISRQSIKQGLPTSPPQACSTPKVLPLSSKVHKDKKDHGVDLKLVSSSNDATESDPRSNRMDIPKRRNSGSESSVVAETLEQGSELNTSAVEESESSSDDSDESSDTESESASNWTPITNDEFGKLMAMLHPKK